MAANYYAVPRMIRDIDIVAGLSTADIDQLCDLFHRDFYVDRDTVRAAIAQQSVFDLIHMERVVKVDFIVRKGTTTFLHSAALDAFREAGWTPVRYFEDGTVFVGRGARRVDQHAVRRVLEARLTELVNARADQVSVLAIGSATKDFLPAPEYVTEQNIERPHVVGLFPETIRARLSWREVCFDSDGGRVALLDDGALVAAFLWFNSATVCA